MPEIPDNMPVHKKVGSIDPGEPGLMGFMDISLIDAALKRVQFSVLEEVDRTVSIIRDPSASYGEVLKAMAHLRNRINDGIKYNSVTASQTEITSGGQTVTTKQLTATRLADRLTAMNSRPRSEAEMAVRDGYKEPVHYKQLEMIGDADSIKAEEAEPLSGSAGADGEAGGHGDVSRDPER